MYSRICCVLDFGVAAALALVTACSAEAVDQNVGDAVQKQESSTLGASKDDYISFSYGCDTLIAFDQLRIEQQCDEGKIPKLFIKIKRAEYDTALIQLRFESTGCPAAGPCYKIEALPLALPSVDGYHLELCRDSSECAKDVRITLKKKQP